MPDAELKSDAIILRRDGKFVVEPGLAKVEPKGRKFTIRNSTEYWAAIVTLPESRVEQGSSPKNREKELQPGEAKSFTLRKVNGPFEYFVVIGSERAQGGSDPVIIIDPPCS